MNAKNSIQDTHRPLRIAVLLSGGGRTMLNIQEYLESHQDLGRIECVISDRKDSLGLERATAAGLQAEHMPCRNRSDGEKIFAHLRLKEINCVLLAGFLRLLYIPEDWLGLVLNIHPSLIPLYCGAGFYGDKVHQAVLKAGEKESGCTVHFVDNIFDNGPILLQKKVDIAELSTADEIAAKVFEAECQAYPEAIELFASGKTLWQDGQIQFTPATDISQHNSNVKQSPNEDKPA